MFYRNTLIVYILECLQSFMECLLIFQCNFYYYKIYQLLRKLLWHISETIKILLSPDYLNLPVWGPVEICKSSENLKDNFVG